ncbi:CLIP domain-containing serine protease B15-like isoform X2 [Drosophila gunungcola]|uniref:CLIP domain-containing serine protease B15-like isoform X2 n=1 Tax=Drosophila gunungcola TaxID=103775 RepID=UPI0022DEA120|nr:CLIP domain-containing serine protease B15-like isoform X2 [Drosophila gunungcola]
MCISRLGEFIGTREKQDTIRSEHNVSQIFKHPFYNVVTHANDIAILGLASNVVYTEHIRPICIPWWTSWKQYIDSIQVFTGSRWGLSSLRNESDAFRTLEVRRQPAEMCTSSNNSSIARSQFCAGNSESNLCNADYSSILGAMIPYKNFSRFVLIGIATTNQRCNMPSIYTDVLSHIDFILRVWRYYGKGQGERFKSSTTRAPKLIDDTGLNSDSGLFNSFVPVAH